MTCHRSLWGYLVVSVTLLLMAGPSKAEGSLKVADMEKKTVFKAFPSTGSSVARAEVVEVTAASGKRSLRFEYDADGKRPGSLVIPFDQSIEDYDVLAFDIYCQAQNGARFLVTVHPQTEGEDPREITEYFGRVDLKDARDGWTTMQLVKDRSLHKRIDERKDNWAKPRAISFATNKTGEGKVVFFVDNVRFLKADDDLSRNLLYNSSFEIATNADAPDGWRRDFHSPPFGRDVWRRDISENWHGQSSMRLGHEGIMASAWGRFVRLIPQQAYTYSVYLKADRPGVKAELEVNGLSRPNRIEVTTDTQWKRYELIGTAFRTRTSVVVRQKSPGVLWIDAAQLEEGEKSTEYYFPTLDRQELQAGASAVAQIPSQLNAQPRQTTIKRLTQAPVIDGKLDETCWQREPNMTDFRELEVDRPSDQNTQAWIAYDDEALYLAVRAMDSDMARVRRMLDGAKSAWTADSIEVFLDTNNDRTSYYQFAVNANASKWYSHFKSVRKRTRWAVDWKTAAAMHDDSWTVEIRIPFTSLKREELGSTFSMNIGRTAKMGDGKGGSAYSSWSYAHAAFHQPRAFGKVVGFDPSVLRPYDLQVVSLGWSQGKARARLENLTGKDVELKVHFKIAGNEKIQTEPVNVSLGKGEIKDISSPLSVERDGTYIMNLVAFDSAGRMVVNSQPSPFTVSGANQYVFTGPEYGVYIQGQTIALRAIVNLEKDQLAGHRIHWQLADKSGEFNARPGVNTWSVDSAGLKLGGHEARASLVHNSRKVSTGNVKLTIASPSPHVVRINRWGRYFEVDGQPFYPFGFFTEALFKTKDLEVWRKILVEMKKNNCTSVLAYMGLRTDMPERLGDYLDVADEVGIKMFVEISSFFAWDIPKVRHIKSRYMDKQTAMADLKEVLRKYRTHPALMGWCAFDEPGNRPDLFTSEVVAEASQVIKSLDPYHPFFCTHLNHMGDSTVYGPSVDVALMPFLASGGRYDSMFREFRDAGLPVMVNSPAYGAAGNSKHEPSIAQQRVNTYKAIIMGAAGTQYYLFRPGSQMLWESMGRMSLEIQQLAPALFTSDVSFPLQVTPASPDQLAVLKRNGDDYYLLAVNTDTQPCELVFDLLSLAGVESVEPLLGSPAVKHQGAQARLTVTLPGQGTAFYRLKAIERH